MARDPVCHMEVYPSRAAGSAEYGGETFFFCAPVCRERFLDDPERYLASKIEDSTTRPGDGGATEPTVQTSARSESHPLLRQAPSAPYRATTTAEIVPGKMWRAMIVRLSAPMLRAAST